MKLLTRREIIETWSKQPDKFLDSYCCPDCRDILQEHLGQYECKNNQCLNTIVYYLDNLEKST